MSTGIKDKLIIVIIAAFIFSGSCAPTPSEPTDKTAQVSTTATIGELGEIFWVAPVAVEGYALVANLDGTGSSQCPPVIRQYIVQNLLKQMPAKTNVDAIIDSPDTAVVRIRGTIPANASKNDYFDLKVEALSGTQTTSLEGGILFATELKPQGQISVGARTLAIGEGPVFINGLDGTSPDKRNGLILAGGRVLNDTQVFFAVKEKNFRLTKQISDRINERFGIGSSRGVMQGQLILSVPARFKKREEKFFSLIRSTYLFASVQDKLIDKLTSELATSADKQSAETSLEAIGITAADKVFGLLNSGDELVRLRASRCLLNIGDDRGLETLRSIVYDKSSKYRMDALEALAYSAKRNDASIILQRLLRDDDFKIMLAAYQQLSRMNDIAISRRAVGRKFFLDTVVQSAKQYIYVTRSGPPTIVLFGPSLYLRVGAFVQSSDGTITINAPSNIDSVQVIRQLSNKQPLKLECSYSLADIIQTLSEPGDSTTRRGLNVPYDTTIAITKQLCVKQAVMAEFFASEPAKIE